MSSSTSASMIGSGIVVLLELTEAFEEGAEEVFELLELVALGSFDVLTVNDVSE